MLSLFQNVEVYREALLKALDEAYVTSTISVDGIDQLVGSITVGACIAFLDEEIPQKVAIALRPSTLQSSARAMSCYELSLITARRSM